MLICAGCGSYKTIEAIRKRNPKAISCCPEREMVEPIKADLLTVYTLETDGVLLFKNRYAMPLSRGKYFVCAFGVVINLDTMTSIVIEKTDWVILPKGLK